MECHNNIAHFSLFFSSPFRLITLLLVKPTKLYNVSSSFFFFFLLSFFFLLNVKCSHTLAHNSTMPRPFEYLQVLLKPQVSDSLAGRAGFQAGCTQRCTRHAVFVCHGDAKAGCQGVILSAWVTLAGCAAAVVLSKPCRLTTATTLQTQRQADE